MTLLAHRNTLTAAMNAHVYGLDLGGSAVCSCGWPETRRGIETDLQTAHRAHVADAFFASGAVRDAASLPDDEALVEAVASSPDRHNRSSSDARAALTALAAALAPTEEKA